jgi:hypothetical protein
MAVGGWLDGASWFNFPNYITTYYLLLTTTCRLLAFGRWPLLSGEKLSKAISDLAFSW